MAKLYSILILLVILSMSASGQTNNISDSLIVDHSSQIVTVEKTAYINPKKAQKVKEYMINGYRYQRDVSSMSEGYNTYQGFYAIKDHIITGKINFISVTYGTTISAYQTGGGTTTHYYLQKEGIGNSIHEVFFKHKPVLSYFNISKAALTEAFEDDLNLLSKVKELTQLKKSDVKSLVKEYNSNNK